MITTYNNIMTKSAPIIPNMLFQCLKVYMIYIDGPKPGINSNLQAVLVDDARSDPRLIPCSGPKIGAKQKKTSWFGGGFFNFLGDPQWILDDLGSPWLTKPYDLPHWFTKAILPSIPCSTAWDKMSIVSKRFQAMSGAGEEVASIGRDAEN